MNFAFFYTLSTPCRFWGKNSLSVLLRMTNEYKWCKSHESLCICACVCTLWPLVTSHNWWVNDEALGPGQEHFGLLVSCESTLVETVKHSKASKRKSFSCLGVFWKKDQGHHSSSSSLRIKMRILDKYMLSSYTYLSLAWTPWFLMNSRITLHLIQMHPQEWVSFKGYHLRPVVKKYSKKGPLFIFLKIILIVRFLFSKLIDFLGLCILFYSIEFISILWF